MRSESITDRIIDGLRRASQWLIAAHIKPDGDTSGSAAALARAGARIGKKTSVCCVDDIPDRYMFLYDGIIVQKIEAGYVPPFSSDAVLVCVDTSTRQRGVPSVIESSPSLRVINIDHHIDNERFGTIDLIDTSSSSTGEIIAHLLEASPWGIAPKEAEALYVAMVTDNGSFSFASTDAKTHETAALLLRRGAVPHLIHERLTSDLSHSALRLWGRAFSSSMLFADGRCAIMCLSRQDFLDTSAAREATENLVNFLLRIKGVCLCALVVEELAGTKVSIRARGPMSARDIALKFGGGGHELASGCTSDLSLEEVVNLLRKEMENAVSIRFPNS